MVNEKELIKKVLDTGAYYVAQQVDSNSCELTEHYMSKEEIAWLEDKGLEYVEKLIAENYEPFTDLSETENKAVEDGLVEYPVFALVNDWYFDINDYEFDKIMTRYVQEKRKNIAKTDHKKDQSLFNRLYATLMVIRSKQTQS